MLMIPIFPKATVFSLCRMHVSSVDVFVQQRGTLYDITAGFLKPRSASESSLFFHFSHDAVVDQIFGFEAPDFFIASSQEANDVTNAVNAGVNFLLIQIDHALITVFRSFKPLETERPRKAFGHLSFIF